MQAVPHACGHPSDETTATAQPLRKVPPPAAFVMWVPGLPDGEPLAGSIRVAPPEQSPPGHLARITPLRV